MEENGIEKKTIMKKDILNPVWRLPKDILKSQTYGKNVPWSGETKN